MFLTSFLGENACAFPFSSTFYLLAAASRLLLGTRSAVHINVVIIIVMSSARGALPF